MKVLSDVIKGIKFSKKQIELLLKKEQLVGKDIVAAKEIIFTYKLLIDQANAFLSYIKDRDEEYIHLYHKKRKAVWKSLKKVMRLK